VQELEIWNEPDSAGFWVPRPDPARYARLYLAARAAIRSVDPTARALIGGLTDAPRFMPELIAADPALRGRIDGVAIHPYAATPEAVIARVAAARSTLNALGLGSVPLYVTEFGWTTSPPGALNWLAASVRPTYIARTVEGLAAGGCMVDAAILYTWYSPRRDPHDSQQWFGISPPGAAGSRAVSAFTAGLRRARRSPARILRCG
jgi:hypothetical protein